MLEHGFVLVDGEGQEAPSPFVSVAADGSITLRLLQAGWNSSPDNYSFSYLHPLRGADETFAVKALAISGNLVIHASSSLPGAELLTVHLKVDAMSSSGADAAAAAAQAKEWQEKTAAGIAIRLLGRQNSTARLGKALDVDGAGGSAGDGAAASAASGTKRPHPTPERPEPVGPRPTPRGPAGGFNPDLFPGRMLFPPCYPRGPPLLWTPDGGLLGPRHPAWGQGVPVGPRIGGGGGGEGGFGLLPRFDPIGPGSGEPDPDHLRVPGLPHFPGQFFQGGAGGRRGMDPDGMFIM